MNIVHVPRRFVRHAWGGTETVILETSLRMLARGHEVEIVCPDALASSPHEVMDGVPVERHPYFYPYWGLSKAAVARLDGAGGNLFSFAMMRALERRPRLDLLHLHTGKRLGGIVRRAAQRRNIPYVITLHGGMFDMPATEQARYTESSRDAFEWGRVLGWWVGSRRVLHDAAAIICVGAEEAARVRRHLPDGNVVHLPNGVDVARFDQGDGARFRRRFDIPSTAELVLTVGRIDAQKNQRVGIEMLAHLTTRPTLHYACIGAVTDEGYLRELHALAASLGVADRLRIVPGLDNRGGSLSDAYHAADVFLLPSVHEPFGIVILEAWAAGRPVVASRVGGVPDVIDDGADGLLVPPRDALATAAAVELLLADRPRAAALAAAGRRKATSQFGWDGITDRLLTLYDDVIHARRSATSRNRPAA